MYRDFSDETKVAMMQTINAYNALVCQGGEAPLGPLVSQFFLLLLLLLLVLWKTSLFVFLLPSSPEQTEIVSSSCFSVVQGNQFGWRVILAF